MKSDKPKILIVDDDLIVRTMAVHQLGNDGYDVHALPDGRKVLETFRSIHPDAVLLDVVLPDRDGFGICRELRSLEGMEHFPIIMLTSLDDEEAICMAFEAGATEFIPKPLNWVHEAYRLRYMLRASRKMNELDKSKKELVQAQRMESLAVLTAGIAHDFNNLLQGIMSYAELLDMDGLDRENSRKAVNEIGKIASRGCSLTSQLLLTSRKDEAELDEIAVEPLLSESVEVLRRTIPKNVDIHLEMSPNLWMLKADASHLQQVLMNLAINASHAMPEGGDLTVTAENVILDEKFCSVHKNCSPGAHVQIEITDTGCGMDKETMEKMYDPFFTTKGPQEGTGLGLAVIYGIIKSHKGHISCESVKGAGTTFRMCIPALEETITAAAPEMPGRIKTEIVCGRGRLVLIAEDEPQIREIMSTFLTLEGYKVLESSDGWDALEKYGSSADKIDAIVLDMNMPNMDGETCLKELASQGCTAPVILATGSLLSSERRHELLENAATIVSKPYERRVLLNALSDAIGAKAS